MGRHLVHFAHAANGDLDRFWLLTALAAVFLVIFSSSQAQDCAHCGIPSALDAPVSIPEWTIRKQVNEVNVLFVAGRHGKSTGDLTQQDLLFWTTTSRRRPSWASEPNPSCLCG